MQDLQYWRHYARAGFRIIMMFAMEPAPAMPGLRPGAMMCTCNRGLKCHAIGKHPKSKGWQNDRRDSEKSIDLKGGRRGIPYYGVSLEDLLVVDVDPRNGGWDGLERLEQALDMNLADEALFVVGTGGGGRHYYFSNPEGVRTRVGMEAFPGIDFKRGRGHYVMGAGSLHSSGGTYEVISGAPDQIGPAPSLLLEIIKAPEWEAYDGPHEEADAALVESALFAIPNDDVSYEEWLVVGMALAHWDNEKNWEFFDRWSQKSTKYDENETDRKFRSFGSTGARTIGTIFGIASDHGWIRPQGPMWGEINEATGELFQAPEVRELASRLTTLFSSVSMSALDEGNQRRDDKRREEMRERQKKSEPAAPVLEAEEPAPAEPMEKSVSVAVKAAPRAVDVPQRRVSADRFQEPDDDFEFGEAPEAVQKVVTAPEYQQAKPAPVAAPASVPPAPKKKRASGERLPLPGLAGRIVDHIEKTAWAFQRPAAEAAALQALSCAAWGAMGYAGAPLSLITLVVADTASGKDHPQKVFTRLMKEIGRRPKPETRSDKDFIYNLAENDGKLCLVVDEAHAFFGAMENDRAPAYMVNMAALLLKAGTSDTLEIARNHLQELTEKYEARIKRHQVMIEKVAGRKGIWEVRTQAQCDSEINKNEVMIERLQAKIIDLETGIKGIHFNLLGSSTPVKFSKYINAETIGSGLTGRSLVFDCGDGAPPQREDVPPDESVEFYELAAMLREISDQALGGLQCRAQDDAHKEFKAIYDKYIANDEMYNHAELGGLHRRIRERVYSVASILSAGNRWIITPEIVRAALRLCENHLSASKSLLKQNEWEFSEKDAKAAITEVVLRILKRTNTESPMARSAFRQRLEKNQTAKKINKQLTNPKAKNGDFLVKRVEELRNSGIISMNASAEEYTRVWLTAKGLEMANK